MNRLILKYGYPITAVILLVFVWVIAQRLTRGVEAVVPLAVAAAIVWIAGVIVLIGFWPRITVGGFKRAILRRGLGDGPVGVNMLSAAPERPSRSASAGGLLATGADDLVYLAGWVDVTKGPQVLHVPDMNGRYYSIQFTDPVTGADVAYVGKRTTGTGAGAFLVCDHRRTDAPARGTTPITLPHGRALIIGRVFCTGEDDRSVAYGLARQIRLAPPEGVDRRGT
ncbi:MAG TPA: DUF1254 domain-containing protein [Microbacterium sp.]|uniref:DUF1254 domain-containing protein n=1 Tax=Microbacterium sp. TaxID=51671 RepID=UPI002B4594D5|nr:DUF1254 domain-containing protein [Microbacterium sp.]HKT56525.1 DUF1254 domain-containing protein [Microbacterium sp.]